MKRYDEVMDKIEVTHEMRGRILDNIQKMDIGVTASRRVIQCPSNRRYWSVVACFVVLLAGIFVAGHMTGVFRTNEPSVAVANGIVKVDSLDRLTAAVGFEVEELDGLPFEAETTAYVSYWNEMAEITYTSAEQTVTFRKSVGTEDNSGDYNAYPSVKEIRIGSLAVTLKGGGEDYTLAVWAADGYAFSVRLSKGITEESLVNLIASAMGIGSSDA